MAQLLTKQHIIPQLTYVAAPEFEKESIPKYSAAVKQTVSGIEQAIHNYDAQQELTSAATQAVKNLYVNSKVSWNNRLESIFETLYTIDASTNYSKQDKRAAATAVRAALQKVEQTNYFQDAKPGRTAKIDDRELLSFLKQEAKGIARKYNIKPSLDEIITQQPINAITRQESASLTPPYKNTKEFFTHMQQNSTASPRSLRFTLLYNLDEEALAYAAKATDYVAEKILHSKNMRVQKFVQECSIDNIVNKTNNALYNVLVKPFRKKVAYAGSRTYNQQRMQANENTTSRRLNASENRAVKKRVKRIHKKKSVKRTSNQPRNLLLVNN